MTNLPKLHVNRGNIGNELKIYLPDLDSFEKTFLDADEASAQTTLTVVSGKQFTGSYVLVGIPGTEKCELRTLSGQTDTTLTVDALDFDHPKGTLVTMIPFNQIEIYSASSVGGSYSLIATESISPDRLFTLYSATTGTATAAYKVRFKNAADTTYSDYSDEVVGSGYSDKTVYSIKKRALGQMGEKIEGILTDEKLDEALWQARRLVDSLRKKWSFRQSFNAVLGTVTVGSWRVAVPTDLRFPNGNDNILGIRIGQVGMPVRYISKQKFDQYYAGSSHTTLGAQIIASATSLTGDSVFGTGDFEESGSLKIGSDELTYTANDETTKTLSGIPASGDGSITQTHAAGTDVWQNVQYGLPIFYTVFEGYIYFSSPFDSSYADQNIYIDYYKDLPTKNSDSDELDEPEYDMYVHYLKSIIRQIKTKGKSKMEEDSDYKMFVQQAQIMASKDRINQDVSISPDIDHLIDEE